MLQVMSGARPCHDPSPLSGTARSKLSRVNRLDFQCANCERKESEPRPQVPTVARTTNAAVIMPSCFNVSERPRSIYTLSCAPAFQDDETTKPNKQSKTFPSPLALHSVDAIAQLVTGSTIRIRARLRVAQKQFFDKFWFKSLHCLT